MPLPTPHQVTLVQSSWQLCLPIADTAANLFYERLFTLDPSLRALFPTEMAEQKRKLLTMLSAAVNGLSNVATLVPVLQALGRRHAAYRVEARHYPIVGQALLDTLALGLGPAFTPETKEAWMVVYGVVADTMIAAQATA
jgi:hemoglobin-like flavoprotein